MLILIGRKSAIEMKKSRQARAFFFCAWFQLKHWFIQFVFVRVLFSMSTNVYAKMFTDFFIKIPTALARCQHNMHIHFLHWLWQSVGSTNSWFVAPMNLNRLKLFFGTCLPLRIRTGEFIETNKSSAKRIKSATKFVDQSTKVTEETIWRQKEWHEE